MDAALDVLFNEFDVCGEFAFRGAWSLVDQCFDKVY